MVRKQSFIQRKAMLYWMQSIEISIKTRPLSIHLPFPDFFKTNYSAKKVRNWHCKSGSYRLLILLKDDFE
jgi:hypothetical protein